MRLEGAARRSKRKNISTNGHEKLDAQEEEVDDCAEIPLEAAEKLPDPPGKAVFQGLAGEIVRQLDPHTEADPVAVLVQSLVAFGSSVGRGPHFKVEGTSHHCNLFAVIVGRSSKARKGTSWDRVRQLFVAAEAQAPFLPPWAECCVGSGASSGEGIIYAIRDADPTIEDTGVDDKRFLVQEGEFAKVLKQCERNGNTLSAILRDAWDGNTLRNLTRGKPIKATKPHVSLVGHITDAELRRLLNETESVNGFANRHLFVFAKRSKYLPEGGGPFDPMILGKRLADAISFAREVSAMRRDEEARDLWHKVYPQLSDGFPGLAGAVCGRAEAQTLRLSMIFALMDQSCLVRREHLEAALALWKYCEDSARWIFGNLIGDEVADRISELLRAAGPEGMSQSSILKELGGHVKKENCQRAFRVLLTGKLVRHATIPTGGRTRRTWYWIGENSP